MARGWRLVSALALAFVAGCAALPDDLGLPYVSNFSKSAPGEELPQGWQKWTLSKFKKPTKYQLVALDGKTVVKASADDSASGLIHPLNVDARTYPLLSWRWMVTDLIAKADNSRKRSEDSPVRVVVTFEGNLEQLSLTDRVFFDNVRLVTGQQMPYATLMYIWENRAKRNSVIPNPHTSRVKMIVAESGRDKVGGWQEVTRNVYEDYRRAFGEEPGAISAIAIMTDTDNTGANVHAYYGDIVFRRVAPPRRTYASD
jgi:hypothetical protein